MGAETSVYKEKYPNLFGTYDWGKSVSDFDVYEEIPPERLISNVNIVPFIEDKCVLIRLDNGNWEIPGGTLEANESYKAAIERELIEEAGARSPAALPDCCGSFRRRTARFEGYLPSRASCCKSL